MLWTGHSSERKKWRNFIQQLLIDNLRISLCDLEEKKNTYDEAICLHEDFRQNCISSDNSHHPRVHVAPFLEVREEHERKRVFGDPSAASLGVSIEYIYIYIYICHIISSIQLLFIPSLFNNHDNIFVFIMFINVVLYNYCLNFV